MTKERKMQKVESTLTKLSFALKFHQTFITIWELVEFAHVSVSITLYEKLCPISSQFMTKRLFFSFYYLDGVQLCICVLCLVEKLGICMFAYLCICVSSLVS